MERSQISRTLELVFRTVEETKTSVKGVISRLKSRPERTCNAMAHFSGCHSLNSYVLIAEQK